MSEKKFIYDIQDRNDLEYLGTSMKPYYCYLTEMIRDIQSKIDRNSELSGYERDLYNEYLIIQKKHELTEKEKQIEYLENLEWLNTCSYDDLDFVQAINEDTINDLRKIKHPSEEVKKFLEDYDNGVLEEDTSYEVDHPTLWQRIVNYLIK